LRQPNDLTGKGLAVKEFGWRRTPSQSKTMNLSDNSPRPAFIARVRLIVVFSRIGRRGSQNRQRTLAREFLRVLAESFDCEPENGFAHTNGEDHMTKIKTLSAVIIFSAAIATPVFAGDATPIKPARVHHARAHETYRGAYNQSDAVVVATPRRDVFGYDGTEQYPRLLYSGN
jgi:hypothetical protein